MEYKLENLYKFSGPTPSISSIHRVARCFQLDQIRPILCFPSADVNRTDCMRGRVKEGGAPRRMAVGTGSRKDGKYLINQAIKLQFRK